MFCVAWVSFPAVPKSARTRGFLLQDYPTVVPSTKCYSVVRRWSAGKYTGSAGFPCAFPVRQLRRSALRFKLSKRGEAVAYANNATDSTIRAKSDYRYFRTHALTDDR